MVSKHGYYEQYKIQKDTKPSISDLGFNLVMSSEASVFVQMESPGNNAVLLIVTSSEQN
jgi:hypothetical protein